MVDPVFAPLSCVYLSLFSPSTRARSILSGHQTPGAIDDDDEAKAHVCSLKKNTVNCCR